MELTWYALLGLLFAGYLVLGGYDYGVGLLLAGDAGPGRRARAHRRRPVLPRQRGLAGGRRRHPFGAFPGLESTVVSGMAPLIVVAVAALLLRHAAIQFRRPCPPPAGGGAGTSSSRPPA